MAPKICLPVLHGWHFTRPCCGQLTIPANLSLSNALILPPTVPLWAGTAWRAAGRQTGQEAAEELPATSREQQHSAQHRCQTLMGFPGLTGVSSSRSWLSHLFLPLTRANGKRSPHQPSLLWAVSCKIQDSRRTSWPQAGTWWWDAEGMCNCHLRHTDCRARKWGQDRGDVERDRSQVKAVCWSRRDVPTDVQVRWRRVAHLGSKT